jgi:hypothetical protein
MTIFTGIRNVNHELVEFDPTLPFLFIDIDGVVNPVPYEREWTGAEDFGKDPLAVYNPKNWRWNKIQSDPKLHYEITREITVELDKWAGERPLNENPANRKDGFKRYRSLIISLMDGMLEELREIIQSHKVQVVYLTYWRSEAIRLLESELQLGAIGYLDWSADYGDHALKIAALSNFYRDNDLSVPFVVIDDEALKGIRTSTQLWYPKRDSTEAENLAIERLNDISRLYLEPDPRWGIDRGQLQQLRSFLDSLEKPV